MSDTGQPDGCIAKENGAGANGETTCGAGVVEVEHQVGLTGLRSV
jgi:hypothetical protein